MSVLPKTALSFAAFLSIFFLQDSASALRWQPTFASRLTLEPTYYFEDVYQETTQVAAAIRYEFEFESQPATALRLRFSPWFYSDPASRSPNEMFIPDITEAAADYEAGDWKLKVGINRFAWGVTDDADPLDVVSARRYIDLLSSQKRGTPSFGWTWEKENWRLEAVYVPIQFESILPGEKSRWLPRDMTYNRQAGFDKIFLADRFSYGYMERREVDEALKNNFGFRGDYRGRWYDVTVVFFQGAPTAPAIFTPIIEGTSVGTSAGNVVMANHVTLQPVYYLRRTVGAGVVVPMDDWIVRLAYANSERLSGLQGLPGWAQRAVFGIETSFAVPFGSILRVRAQASFARHEEQADNLITSLDRIFDQAWILGLDLMSASDWVFSVTGLYDAARSGGYARLKIERKVAGGLTASLTGDWFDGLSGTLLGTYRTNKRVVLSTTVFF